MEKRRVLMILSYFVPDPSSGTFRSLGLANHLAQNGWAVDVVTVSESDISRPDPLLYDSLDSRVRILRYPKVDVVEQFRKRLTRFASGLRQPRGCSKSGRTGKEKHGDYFRLSSRAMRWMWPLYLPDKSLQWALSVAMEARVRRLARSSSVLYSSSPAHSVHMAAAILKGTSGRPWVADLRDPWAENPLRVLPLNSVARAYDRILEQKVIGRADWVVCNTPPMEEAYSKRFAGRVCGISTVLNGFDERIFSYDASENEMSSDDRLTVVHVGSLYGLRDITPVLEALTALKRQQPEVARDFSFQFVGPNTENYTAIVDRLRLNGMVTLRGPVPPGEGLAWDRRATICLCLGLTGTENQSQVPAKLYQFIALGKPVLALARPESAMAGVLKQSGLQYLLADPEHEASILEALVSIHHLWSESSLQYGGNTQQRKKFNRKNMAHSIEKIFNHILNLRHY